MFSCENPFIKCTSFLWMYNDISFLTSVVCILGTYFMFQSINFINFNFPISMWALYSTTITIRRCFYLGIIQRAIFDLSNSNRFINLWWSYHNKMSLSTTMHMHHHTPQPQNGKIKEIIDPPGDSFITAQNNSQSIYFRWK